MTGPSLTAIQPHIADSNNRTLSPALHGGTLDMMLAWYRNFQFVTQVVPNSASVGLMPEHSLSIISSYDVIDWDFSFINHFWKKKKA